MTVLIPKPQKIQPLLLEMVHHYEQQVKPPQLAMFLCKSIAPAVSEKK